MSEVERNFIASIDDLILKASGKSLETLQQLDFKHQLSGETFYDVYAINSENKLHENIPSANQKHKNKT